MRLILTAVLSVLAHCGFGGAVNAQASVELIPFLENWLKQPVEIKTNLSLKTEWIGTVKRAYLLDPLKIYKDDEPRHIRFNEVFARKSPWWTNEPVRLSIVSVSSKGYYMGGDAPKYCERLPSVAQIVESKKLSQLESYFGKQHGVTDSWGDHRTNHWTEGWVCFCVEKGVQLRYLSIFVHVSSLKGAKDADIDTIEVREGKFRPANPDSIEERVQFKTAEELFSDDMKQRNDALKKYPLPLRRLMAARQNWDDPDLKAYKKEIEAFRMAPDVQLLKQIVNELHNDGTIEIELLLNALFDDNYFAPKPWLVENRRLAVRQLAEALPEIKKGSVLRTVVMKVLAMQGGGKFALKGKNADWEIDVSVEMTKDSKSMAYRSIPGDGQTAQAAQECLEELKKRYPKLWEN